MVYKNIYKYIYMFIYEMNFQQRRNYIKVDQQTKQERENFTFMLTEAQLYKSHR